MAQGSDLGLWSTDSCYGSATASQRPRTSSIAPPHLLRWSVEMLVLDCIYKSR